MVGRHWSLIVSLVFAAGSCKSANFNASTDSRDAGRNASGSGAGASGKGDGTGGPNGKGSSGDPNASTDANANGLGNSFGGLGGNGGVGGAGASGSSPGGVGGSGGSGAGGLGSSGGAGALGGFGGVGGSGGFGDAGSLGGIGSSGGGGNGTPGTISNSGGVGGNISTSGGTGNIGDGSGTTCLVHNAGDYNIVLVFDNSGSQTTTDPQYTRRSGALAFIDEFAAYVTRLPTAVVNFSVVSFNTSAKSSTWMRLSAGTTAAVKQQITAATTSPNGGTAYTPALKQAGSLLAQIGSKPVAAGPRTYVVFLTDGLPNAAATVNTLFGSLLGGLVGGTAVETMADIPVAVNALVANYGAAVYSVASGADIPTQGEYITQSLAKPTTGLVEPSHVGRYFRAKTADDLKTVWSAVLKAIAKC